MSDLKGRLALVTGASRGIGRQIAADLAADGARVVAASRKQSDVDGVAREIESRGGQAFGLELDVSDREQVKSALSALVKEQGAVEILVNNAGITRDNIFMRMKDEEWDQVLEVNLTSGFRLCRAAIKGMMKRRTGRIVGITSVVGVTGNPGQANYAAAKAGMIGMYKSLAREVASRNITVNTIAPGFIETAMTDALNDKQKESILGSVPAGRLGTSAEIAAAALYLASDEAAYVTGQTLHVNGGMAMI